MSRLYNHVKFDKGKISDIARRATSTPILTMITRLNTVAPLYLPSWFSP